jgi:thiamine-phosphate pyrophosphorylase
MNPLHRIVDANANRAREALRVMEDVARFGLDDAALVGALKSLRHGLRTALDQPALDKGLLVAARDAAEDVGQDIKTDAELSRTGLRDIASAAAARLGEALRSIEESAKALGANAVPIEQLRYEAYRVEQRLLQSLPTGACPQWRLCVLVTESLCARPWAEVARFAIEGGADCIQLREKALSDRETIARIHALREIAAGRAAVILNDRVDLALACGATGVHLGQTDLGASEARDIAGHRLLIGVSTSNLAEAHAAVLAGADYCGVGPMFATTTKHKPVLSGPEYLSAYLANPVLAQRPHLAIGGISSQNVDQLRRAGCRGIAVSSAVCGADDPAEACRRLLAGLATPV